MGGRSRRHGAPPRRRPIWPAWDRSSSANTSRDSAWSSTVIHATGARARRASRCRISIVWWSRSFPIRTRLTSGAADLTSNELRADDYVPARRAEEEGTIRLVELGVAIDADAFWFCMDPAKKAKDPRFAFLQKREFRQALSHAVDREAQSFHGVDAVVEVGAGAGQVVKRPSAVRTCSRAVKRG